MSALLAIATGIAIWSWSVFAAAVAFIAAAIWSTRTPAPASAVPAGVSTRREVAAVETLTPGATETPSRPIDLEHVDVDVEDVASLLLNRHTADGRRVSIGGRLSVEVILPVVTDHDGLIIDDLGECFDARPECVEFGSHRPGGSSDALALDPGLLHLQSQLDLTHDGSGVLAHPGSPSVGVPTAGTVDDVEPTVGAAPGAASFGAPGANPSDAGASPIDVMALAAVFIVGMVVAPFAAQPIVNTADLVFWVCVFTLALAALRALKLPSTDAPKAASPVPSPVTGQQVPAPQAGTIQQVAASSLSDAATITPDVEARP